MATYKNEKDWEDISLTELAYQGENEEEGHTKQDLIDACKGNEYTAEMLFKLLDWQSPHTLLDEWEREGEIDEQYNLLKQ